MRDYDADLMLQAAQGDLSSYRELFDRHYKRGVNIAYRMLGNRDIAEDIAMDAFARVWESRASYKPTAKFSTYLYRIVVNLCVNAGKRKRFLVDCELDESILKAPSGSDPAVGAERAETTRVVRDAVLQLPENQRTAIILTRYEELSYQVAAEVMGVSIKAIESLLHRAKANLRKELCGLLDELPR